MQHLRQSLQLHNATSLPLPVHHAPRFILRRGTAACSLSSGSAWFTSTAWGFLRLRPQSCSRPCLNSSGGCDGTCAGLCTLLPRTLPPLSVASRSCHPLLLRPRFPCSGAALSGARLGFPQPATSAAPLVILDRRVCFSQGRSLPRLRASSSRRPCATEASRRCRVSSSMVHPHGYMPHSGSARALGRGARRHVPPSSPPSLSPAPGPPDDDPADYLAAFIGATLRLPHIRDTSDSRRGYSPAQVQARLAYFRSGMWPSLLTPARISSPQLPTPPVLPSFPPESPAIGSDFSRWLVKYIADAAERRRLPKALGALTYILPAEIFPLASPPPSSLSLTH